MFLGRTFDGLIAATPRSHAYFRKKKNDIRGISSNGLVDCRLKDKVQDKAKDRDMDQNNGKDTNKEEDQDLDKDKDAVEDKIRIRNSHSMKHLLWSKRITHELAAALMTDEEPKACAVPDV